MERGSNEFACEEHGRVRSGSTVTNGGVGAKPENIMPDGPGASVLRGPGQVEVRANVMIINKQNALND